MKRNFSKVMIKSIEEIKTQYSTDEICEMIDRLNGWEWDDRIGDKPDGFDDLPRYNIRWWHKLMNRPTRRPYLEQAMWNLQSLVTAKEYYHHHHAKNLGVSEEEFEMWWRQHGKGLEMSGCYKESGDSD